MSCSCSPPIRLYYIKIKTEKPPRNLPKRPNNKEPTWRQFISFFFSPFCLPFRHLLFGCPSSFVHRSPFAPFLFVFATLLLLHFVKNAGKSFWKIENRCAGAGMEGGRKGRMGGWGTDVNMLERVRVRIRRIAVKPYRKSNGTAGQQVHRASQAPGYGVTGYGLRVMGYGCTCISVGSSISVICIPDGMSRRMSRFWCYAACLHPLSLSPTSTPFSTLSSRPRHVILAVFLIPIPILIFVLLLVVSEINTEIHFPFGSQRPFFFSF